MQTDDIKWEIEKLRAELERKIESSGGEEGICLDKKLIELSMDVDELINIYIKEQQKNSQ